MIVERGGDGECVIDIFGYKKNIEALYNRCNGINFTLLMIVEMSDPDRFIDNSPNFSMSSIVMMSMSEKACSNIDLRADISGMGIYTLRDSRLITASSICHGKFVAAITKTDS